MNTTERLAEALRALVATRYEHSIDCSAQGMYEWDSKVREVLEAWEAERAAPAPGPDLLTNIESPFNACMHREHCKGWKQAAADEAHAFKNFHQRLCERFGYMHDEQDWRRDLASLEEWIAKRAHDITGDTNE